MAQAKAVVLTSGGLNSAVVTSIATQDLSVAMLHVRFGHRAAQREEDLFNKQADHFQIKERMVVDLPHFGAIGHNARVSRRKTIEDALAIGDGPSNCYVPGLVSSLLSVGFSWASEIGATKIMIGVSENLGPPAPKTCAVYPDYSREYIQLCNHMFCVATSRKRITVEAPIIDLDRAEIVKLGHRLKTPFELTWSCVSSGSEPCGGCVGCATRNRGFLDATIPDPVMTQMAMT